MVIKLKIYINESRKAMIHKTPKASVVKKVRNDGHILLGKKYAGKRVFVEQIEDGIWLIKADIFISDNEKWLHTPEVSAALCDAIRWAEKHPPQETDLDELEKRLGL